MDGNDTLRISLIAGGLGKGGAEKQFMYLLRALQEMNFEFQVITLTRGEYYEEHIVQQGIRPIYVGSNVFERIANITKAARRFSPHFIQSSHFFAALYSGLSGSILGVPSIGAIRTDLYLDLEKIGRTGPLLLRLPSVWLANSLKARENAAHLGLSPEKVHVLHNVIDLEDFDRSPSSKQDLLMPGYIYAVTVARLVPVKRLERFLAALALARIEVPALVGLVIGDGPLATELRAAAENLNLQPDNPNGGVRFLGERNDIPQLLEQSDLFVLTSDREGFPNVLLEAMAASLPIITTPVGETYEIIVEGLNGFFTPPDDPQALAQRMVELAQSPALRQRIGNEGRLIVERQYSYSRLKNNLLKTYHEIAHQTRNRKALSILDKNLSLESETIRL